MPTHPPLRVAILVDTLTQPAWVHRVLRDICESTSAGLVLVIRNGAYRDEPLPALIRAYRNQLLPLLYDRLDARLTKPWRRPDAFARASIEPLITGIPILDVATIRKRYSDYFPDADVERIMEHGLDVALRFGFRILRGRALKVARYGVWSYHHADNLEIRGGPNSFWEVMQARPVTGAVLQVLTPDLDNGRIIARTHSATNPRSLSLSRNRHYWKAAALIIRKLQDLHHRGPAALADDPLPDEFRPYDRPIYRRPTNLQSAPILARFSARLAGHAAQRLLTRDDHHIAVHLARRDSDAPPALYRFRPLPSPAGRQWSHPFPLEHDGRYVIFLAERPAHGAPSHLAAVELTPTGPLAPLPVTLGASPSNSQQPTAYSLSYPFVFRWRDHTYLLPTIADRADLTLYHCASFPDRWQPERTLLTDVHAAHATLTEVGGAWWLFVALAEAGAEPTDELHLFWAESPLGPWKPHPRNPVKSDVRSARPAGRLFTWRGRLYRPAQVNAPREGAAISINRVDELSLDHYAETEVSRIQPLWQPGLVATGVFNRAGRLTCVDTTRSSFRHPWSFRA